jgi:uncharacterized protein (DUF736 family)
VSDFVNKPGLGTMRANKFKDAENKPDIKGEITLFGGEVVKFAGWKKEDKNGGTYYSLKQDKPREGGERHDTNAGPRDMGGDDPFSDPVPF